PEGGHPESGGKDSKDWQARNHRALLSEARPDGPPHSGSRKKCRREIKVQPDFYLPPSYTTLPPTTVVTTFASWIVSGGIRVRSRSRITKSASLPRSSVPLRLSANSA